MQSCHIVIYICGIFIFLYVSLVKFSYCICRAFIAYEKRVPVNASEEYDVRFALNDYKEKLMVDGHMLPDPFTLKKGWQTVRESIALWPNLYLTDIVQYLNMGSTKQFVGKILNEYKQGKAYM